MIVERQRFVKVAFPKRAIQLYRYLSIGLLLAAIVLLGILFYKVMAGFFLPLFMAALLVVIFRPMHIWILGRVRGRKKIASGISTLIILLMVLVPLTLIGIFAAAEGRAVVRRLDPATIGDKIKLTRSRLGLEMPAIEKFTRIEAAIHAMEAQVLPPNIAAQRTQLAYDANELRAYARELAEPLTLKWPAATTGAESESTDPEITGRTELAWLAFADTVENNRKKLSEEHWKNLVDEEEQQHALAEARQEFKIALDRYFEFKSTLLGGPVRSWLTEIANPDEQEVRTYVEFATSWARDKVLSFGGATTAFAIRFLFDLVIMALALFSFFLDGPAMLAALKRLTPMDDAHADELIREFDKVSRAVVLATLLAALAQGLLGALGYYFAGLEPVMLLMLLTMTLALVPFVGAAAVWVPASLYIGLIEGRMVAGVILAVYGAAIVSMADNVIKPLVLHGQSNLHPLWALLSVLGGVTALGPVGILVGPMVVAFLQTLLNILQREISVMERPAETAPPATNRT